MTRYADYKRGTTTGRTYEYAGCHVEWNGQDWIAYGFGETAWNIIAYASGIKPMRNKLHAMKMAKEGPWEVKA